MSMPAGKLFANLLTQVGLNTADPKYMDLLSITAEVPDEAVQAISSGLTSVDGAKQNPELKKHFTATVLNGVDSKIQEVMDELGLDPTVRAQIMADKNSFNRIKLLANQIKGAQQVDPQEKQQLLAEIAQLQQQLAQSNESNQKALQDKEAEYNNSLLDLSLRNDLGNMDYAYDLPKDVNVSNAMNLLNIEMNNKKAKAARQQDGSLKLVSQDDPQADYMEDNKAVGWDDFRSKTLANHKLLKVTDAAQPAASGKKETIPGTKPEQGGEDFYAKQLEKIGAQK